MGRSAAARVERGTYTETLGPEVGQRIRAARQERQLSLAQLGGKDLSRSFLSLVELGRSRISLKALSIVANRLELPMSYFLEGDMVPRAAAAELMLDEAQTCIDRGDPAAALQVLDRAELPDSSKARAGQVRATALLVSDRARDAVRVAEEALLVAQRHHDFHREVHLRYVMGASLYRMGAWEEAQSYLGQVVDKLTSEDDDPSLLAKATVTLGHILFVKGDIDGAIGYYDRARDLFGVVTNLDSMATVYSGLSLAYQRKQDFTAALHYSKMSLAMYERRQNLLGAAVELNNIAMRHLQLDDLASARSMAVSAVERAKQAGSTDTEAVAYSTMAQISFRLEEFDVAYIEAEKAVDLASDDSSLARVDGWAVLAGLADRDGDNERADELFTKALEALRESDQQLRYAEVAVAYSMALRRRGETDKAFELAFGAVQAKGSRSA
jgi:tetratricopeptide (TPR) repeat protein